MSKRPKYWNSAVKYLSKKDPVMKKLISQYKDKTLTTRKTAKQENNGTRKTGKQEN